MKICHVRPDFQHNLSTNLSKNHPMMITEGLKITNMSQSARGTVEKPGKNVQAKSELNRSLLDQGWSEFKRELKYNLDWLGGVYKEVPPSNTSQKCSSCSTIDKKSQRSPSTFRCMSCGYIENADINGTKNILPVGHAV